MPENLPTAADHFTASEVFTASEANVPPGLMSVVSALSVPPSSNGKRGRPAPTVPLDSAAALQHPEAAAALGMSIDSFDRYVKAHVEVIRRGSMRLYPVAGLLRWLEENKEAADAAAREDR